MNCPLGPNNEPLFFNSVLGVCDYRRKVKCFDSGVGDPPITEIPITFLSTCPAINYNTRIIRAAQTGYIKAVFIVHTYGHFSYNRWGCSGKLGVYITRSKNEILYPNLITTQVDKFNCYDLDDQDGKKFQEDADFIIFSDETRRVHVQEGELLQVWYGDELIDPNDEEINSGPRCVNVDVKYF